MMALFERKDALKSLTDLLAREHTAILDGDFSSLQGMLGEKERLLEALGSAKPGGRALDTLRIKSARNNEMLEAAARGIKAAVKRLEASRKPTSPLRTYDKSGQPTSHSDPANNLERRA